MHYYKFHISDYRRDTAHLTPIEHYIYRELIDLYYMQESPIDRDERKLIRLLRLDSERDANALRNVCDDFFLLEDGLLIHPRIELDLKDYREKSDKARESAKARWKKQSNKKQEVTCSDNANAMRTHCEGNANHKPITNNHNKTLVEEKDDSSDFKEEKKHTEDDEKMANFMFARILDVAPKQKKPDIGKWADTIRLMRERDNLTHKEIQDVFIWANTDSFWKANILSPAKLRDKFSALDAKMRSGNGTHQQSGKQSVAERQTELRKLAEARAAEIEANS